MKKEIIINWENTSKEQFKFIIEGLVREIEYYRKLLKKNKIKY